MENVFAGCKRLYSSQKPPLSNGLLPCLLGLSSSVATEDMARARRLGRKLNTGILAAVTTSTPTGGGVSIPMEGHKQSGFGMEGGVAGLKAYTVATMVNMYI